MQNRLSGCIILRNNCILLLKRKLTQVYELPGGKIEEGESQSQAAIRELKEELNVDVTIILRFGYQEFEENNYIMGYNWFMAKIDDISTLKVNEKDKFDEYKFINLANIEEIPLSSNMKNLVKVFHERGML